MSHKCHALDVSCLLIIRDVRPFCAVRARQGFFNDELWITPNLTATGCDGLKSIANGYKFDLAHATVLNSDYIHIHVYAHRKPFRPQWEAQLAICIS